MINNKKKSRIRYTSPDKKEYFNFRKKTEKDQNISKEKNRKKRKLKEVEKKSDHSRKKFYRSYNIEHHKDHEKNSRRTSSKKYSSVSSKNYSKRSSNKQRSSEKITGRQKNKLKSRQQNKKSHKKQDSCKKSGFIKNAQPNDQYYGKKQQFICAANTEQTLNDSRAFFNRYTRIVNRIKSLETYHENQYQIFKNNLQQHEMMRLVKIHSLQRNRIQSSLMNFIERS